MTRRLGKRLRESLVWTAVLATAILLIDQIDLSPGEQPGTEHDSLCRSITLTATTLMADDDQQQLDSILRALTVSDPSVHAIEVLGPDGRAIAQTNPAGKVAGGTHTGSINAIRIPLSDSGQRLGELGIDFVNADDDLGAAAAFVSPSALALLLLITPIGFLGFFCSSAGTEDLASSGTPENENSDGLNSIDSAQPETTGGQESIAPEDANRLGSADVESCEDTVIELSSPPIFSSLPIDDEEIREVIDKYIERLGPRIKGMHQALQSAEFGLLQSEAHWLKGSGGTVGYDQLTEPAKQLEQAAKDRDVTEALAILEQLELLQTRMAAGRVAIRGQQVEAQRMDDQRKAHDRTSPIHCRLPLHDPDYRDIVIEFIERLDVRLMGMLSLLQKHSFRELENEAHWLKGSGGTVGFPEISEPAERLLLAARREDVESCQSGLRDILDVRQRIAVPDENLGLAGNHG